MATLGSGALLGVLLTFLQGLHGGTGLEVIPSVNPVPAGDNETLVIFPPVNRTSGVWEYGDTTILLWLGDRVDMSEAYRDRASMNVSTGDLSLRWVTVNDTGDYSFQSLVPMVMAKASLTVLEPVSNVTVTASETDLVELNDTDDNRTLKISNVLRTDSGPLVCIVSNGINNVTSDPVHLSISFGPDDMTFLINGQSNNLTFSLGSNLTLTCSAQSSPPAQFRWAFNEKPLDEEGPEYTITGATETDSGNYTCQAHNNVTLRYISLTEMIKITSRSESVQPATVAVAFLSLLMAMTLQ
ncbi:hypothetical protein AGOR_G00212140 [Albula goreensis]|uniref:Ig-like domain-containing protein n=1 Tax=Albula goreensis TaxID=1534307 RepID=A0A8T3CUT4_9TELE|nr:hypothetical protein AGOR_G00212140 [Albula goreensis]